MMRSALILETTTMLSLGRVKKWLIAALMFAPLGSCVATFTISARAPEDRGVAVLGLAAGLAAAGVWLALVVFLFRSPLVKRQHRVPWLFALSVWLPLSAPVFFFSYLWRTPEEKAARPTDSNRAHLLKMWAVVGALWAFLLAGLVAAIVRGTYFVPVVALMALPAIFALIRFNQWRLRRLFCRGDADRILKYLAHQLRGFKWMPHGECTRAGTLAGAAAIMGEFQRARTELGAANWEGRPSVYLGIRDSVMALLALLEERDPAKALALARSARNLADMPGAFPGAERSRASLDAMVAAAEVLAGANQTELLAAVENMARQLPQAQRAVPACALSVYYAKQGDSVRAQQYRKQLTEVAPHARALMDLAGMTAADWTSTKESASWGALLRSVSLPVAALAALIALAWVLPPDKHPVRRSRPVVIPSPPALAGLVPNEDVSREPAALAAMLKEARTALDAQENDRAIQILDRVLRVSPDDSGALFSRAYAYDNKREHVRAIQDLDRMLRLEPQNAAALDNRGAAYLNLGDFDRAIRDFDESIRLSSSNALAFNNRGFAYLDKEDFPQAIRDFEEAIRLRPDFTDAIDGRERAVRRKYESEHPFRSLLRLFRQDTQIRGD
jgi:tetratricopeptide (TPR) repeat protein